MAERSIKFIVEELYGTLHSSAKRTKIYHDVPATISEDSQKDACQNDDFVLHINAELFNPKDYWKTVRLAGVNRYKLEPFQVMLLFCAKCSFWTMLVQPGFCSERVWMFYCKYHAIPLPAESCILQKEED